MTSVTIKGRNQGANKVTWYGIAPSSNHSETTTGWWWARSVSIITKYDEWGVAACRTQIVNTVLIPADYSSNVFPVTIPLDAECGRLNATLPPQVRDPAAHREGLPGFVVGASASVAEVGRSARGRWFGQLDLYRSS
ncbi:MAG TPA: hypothetical protein VII50_04230 [Acidothermaceae bacterium]